VAIQVRGVSKRFGDAVALENVNLDVPTGSLTALLGPSGGGKSTLLRVVAGLESPDSGQVFIDGEDVTGLAPRDRGIGFCFQHYAAFRHMNVWDNVAFGLKVRRRPKAEIRRRVTELLELVRLEGFAQRYPSQLSGGQRQRMALARALAVEPRLLLLDEPFGALDAQVRKELRAWLRRLHDEVHITTVLVTHDQEEAMDVADRLAVIHLGHLEQVGTSAELYDNPVNDFVLTFVGPATSIGGRYVRPHDVSISRQPAATGSYPAEVLRVTHLGFEVRVELALSNAQAASGSTALDNGRDSTWVQLDRATARTLDLKVGESVFLIPRDVPGGLRPTADIAAEEFGPEGFGPAVAPAEVGD
jgi:sulfate/thiosulfate transport system ATP-binding protein